MGTERKTLSRDAQRVAETLSEPDRAGLGKDNPFLTERNRIIRRLRHRGVLLRVLSELTGLSTSSLHRIEKGGEGEAVKASVKAYMSDPDFRRALMVFLKALENISQKLRVKALTRKKRSKGRRWKTNTKV